MSKTAVKASVVLVGVCLAVFFYMSYNGIWPPDVFFARRTVLATASSQSGELFKIVQFWKGYDLSYTTQIEQTGPNGKLYIVVIDGDDLKLWSCLIKVIEEEKKLVIVLPDGSPPIEYLWDQKQFILSPGRQRVRD